MGSVVLPRDRGNSPLFIAASQLSNLNQENRVVILQVLAAQPASRTASSGTGRAPVDAGFDDRGRPLIWFYMP
jgi:hypothetical protein